MQRTTLKTDRYILDYAARSQEYITNQAVLYRISDDYEESATVGIKMIQLGIAKIVEKQRASTRWEMVDLSRYNVYGNPSVPAFYWSGAGTQLIPITTMVEGSEFEFNNPNGTEYSAFIVSYYQNEFRAMSLEYKVQKEKKLEQKREEDERRYQESNTYEQQHKKRMSIYRTAVQHFNQEYEKHRCNCLFNTLIDDLYFIQNNKWEDILPSGKSTHKARRTPEEIAKAEQFNMQMPQPPEYNPPSHTRTPSVAVPAKSLFQSPYGYHTTTLLGSLNKNPSLFFSNDNSKTETSACVKFTLLDVEQEYAKNYQHIYINLEKKVELFIRKCKQHKRLLLSFFYDQNIVINNHTISVYEMLTNPWHLQKFQQDILSQKEGDAQSAKNKAASLKQKIVDTNYTTLAKKNVYLENIKPEQNSLAFEKMCASTFKYKIMPHNEQQAIKAFAHMHSLLGFNLLDSFQREVSGGKITQFHYIEEYAFKHYLSESTALRILKEQQELLNLILYAPFFVNVECEPDTMPKVYPAATFADNEEEKQFINWYRQLPIKPWKLDSSTFVNQFIEAYVANRESDFIKLPDSMLWLINTQKLFSAKQIYYYILENNSSRAAEVFDKHFQDKLQGNRLSLSSKYEKLHAMQSKLDAVDLSVTVHINYFIQETVNKTICQATPYTACMSDPSHETFKIIKYDPQATLSPEVIELDRKYTQYVHDGTFARQYPLTITFEDENEYKYRHT